MRYIDEYRNPEIVRRLAQKLGQLVTRNWTIMEVCGGQTHSILKNGLDQLLPTNISLVHGPGCPVCVTPISEIDRAIELVTRHGVTLCTFGDMMRVPGTEMDLFTARARGGDVQIVYSPLDALHLARKNPGKEVVFFAVGFETTAPVTATALLQAERENMQNFSVLMAHVRVPPALELLLSSPVCKINGFLAPGHVCTVMGYREYEELSQKHRVPIVITGFEPVDIMSGIFQLVKLLEAGRVEVVNRYRRSVVPEGNLNAQALIEKVFCVVDREWRGVGCVRNGGFSLRNEFANFDAVRKFGLVTPAHTKAESRCRAGEVLMGKIKPTDCPHFGIECTPGHPIGAPMVSSEGACAAYYLYIKNRAK